MGNRNIERDKKINRISMESYSVKKVSFSHHNRLFFNFVDLKKMLLVLSGQHII